MDDATGGRGWAAVELSTVPSVPTSGPGDPDWKPLQHYLGLAAFGLNTYSAAEAGVLLAGEHDEAPSGQEEAYVVLAGRARFTVAGESFELGPGGVVAVRDPAATRSAEALEPGTTLLGVGSAPGCFETSWGREHFDDVPRHPTADS